MTVPTSFTWLPDAGAKHTVKPVVNVAKFGDSYEQRSAQGLNTLPQVWSVTFTRSRSIGLAILTFLRLRRAVESFRWTNPLGEDGVYVCRSWNVTSTTPEIMEVTGDFEQVFES